MRWESSYWVASATANSKRFTPSKYSWASARGYETRIFSQIRCARRYKKHTWVHASCCWRYELSEDFECWMRLEMGCYEGFRWKSGFMATSCAWSGTIQGFSAGPVCALLTFPHLLDFAADHQLSMTDLSTFPSTIHWKSQSLICHQDSQPCTYLASQPWWPSIHFGFRSSSVSQSRPHRYSYLMLNEVMHVLIQTRRHDEHCKCIVAGTLKAPCWYMEFFQSISAPESSLRLAFYQHYWVDASLRKLFIASQKSIRVINASRTRWHQQAIVHPD